MPMTVRGDNASVDTSGTKKKKKNFIKTVVRGLSLKKKKKRPDDVSEVGVHFDGVDSVATTAAAGRGDPPTSILQRIPENGDGDLNSVKPIRIVLLLMDPSSHRFELLQLEFDSDRARVSDVLRQVQHSATETILRDMTYAGVCDQDGTEMIAVMKLSKFCKGNDVIIAIPNGMTGTDAAKLAGPILLDPKVGEMLSSCRAKVKSKQAKKTRLEDTKLSRIQEESPSNDSKRHSLHTIDPTKKASSSNLPTAILGIILSSLLYVAARHHVRLSSRLESGSILLRGQWKSQCGIFELLPEKWLYSLPMDKIFPSCNPSSSSVLELGRDGTLRYFTRGTDGQRKEA
ncbi:hypothetical protein ACHAXA_009592 [Cyclostephanos tholiformis]|uniref:Uncharacterized protein n=1 Tax=Cyclostephanos tholiformis TaxID=382380 RepID=A0ABD3RG14_9STRA